VCTEKSLSFIVTFGWEPGVYAVLLVIIYGDETDGWNV